MTSIIIGRKGQQPYPITENTVSGKHCRLDDLGNGRWRLTDLGSTNGTFVNGLPVVETEVTPDTPIMLAQLSTTVRQLLGLKSAAGAAAGAAPNPAKNGSVSVAHLERVYDNYEAAMRDLAKRRSRAQIMRMLPMQLGVPLVLGVGGMLIDNDAVGNTVKGLLTVGLTALSGTLALRMLTISNDNIDEQFELNKRFQTDYVCPKCRNFLGASKPYQAVVNQGQCPYCKTKFNP